ncbi:MAG: GNAT family N-acetyltransferase [Bacteroidales bacterium]|nr:GNAT family N-acetyltransferase [Bacteroidales bacterium]
MTRNSFIITKFKGNKSKYFQHCISIRKQVFVIEQNVPEELEADEFDATANHLLLSSFIEPNELTHIATARWRITDYGIKLERFAVIKPFRNKGFGKIILNNVLDEVIKLHKPIYLHSQEDAVPFYLKNNFRIIGEPFIEANIRHFKMIYSKA